MTVFEFDIDTHDAIEFIDKNIAGATNRVRVCQELAALAPLIWVEEGLAIIRLVDQPTISYALRQQPDAIE